jgi:predicted secreted Zn-dependent protease
MEMKTLPICFLALLLLKSILIVSIDAAPDVEVNTEYYPVYGETEREIRDYLGNNYLVGENGEDATALTKSSLEWKIDMLMDDSFCRITSADVVVEITFVLPRLDDSDLLEPDLLNKWETFMRAVEDHELGHHDITVEWVEKVDSMLQNLGPEASCDILKANANEMGNMMIEKAKEMHRRYDDDTEHGAREGVVF